ncbi:Fc.00g082590.m01.CDS01 [Cosmosporella sp. VM-42]
MLAILAKITLSIHLDLLAAKLIPDPFIGRNEEELQWIHSKIWVYTTKFEASPVGENERVDLVLEGLDTFAIVKFNGNQILK